jgi:hypothetical protein
MSDADTEHRVTREAIDAHFARFGLACPDSWSEIEMAARTFRLMEASHRLMMLIERGWTSEEIAAGRVSHGSQIANDGTVHRPTRSQVPDALAERARRALAGLRRLQLHNGGATAIIASNLDSIAFGSWAGGLGPAEANVEQAEQVLREAEAAAVSRP